MHFLDKDLGTVVMRLDYWGTLSFFNAVFPLCLKLNVHLLLSKFKGFFVHLSTCSQGYFKENDGFLLFSKCMLFLCIGAHGDLSLNDSVFNLEHTQDLAPSHL